MSPSFDGSAHPRGGDPANKGRFHAVPGDESALTLPNGATWPVGADTIRAMIRRGELEKVTPDAALAERQAQGAHSDLGAARLTLEQFPASAFDLAYDSARKAVVALLEHQGLRVRAGGEGGHAIVGDVVDAQLGADQGRAFHAMRRLRNANQYPRPDADGAKHADAEVAIERAARLVDACVTLRSRIGVFR